MPCRDICRFDRRTGWCRACGRTKDACRGWKKARPHQQRNLAADLPRRLARMVSMLCCLLALCSAATASASAVDRLQHHPGAPIEHAHMLLSDLSMVADHADDSGSGSPDHPPGHHHHGDSGTGLPVLHPDGDAFLSPGGSQPVPSLATLSRGDSVAGPERPPKLANPIAT